MVKYRNVRVRKRGGGYRLQRAMVLKSGKLKFVKNLRRATSKVKKSIKRRSTRKRKNNPNRRKNKSMARRNMTLPLGTLVGVGAGFIIGQNSNSPLENIKQGNFEMAAVRYIENMTGLNVKSGSWNLGRAKGALALLVGVGLSMLASRFGVNRRLGRAGIPLIRI